MSAGLTFPLDAFLKAPALRLAITRRPMLPGAAIALSLVNRHAPHASVLTRRADTDDLGETIAALAARLHAATYELLVLRREFDESSGWNNGFLSCAHRLHSTRGRGRWGRFARIITHTLALAPRAWPLMRQIFSPSQDNGMPVWSPDVSIERPRLYWIPSDGAATGKWWSLSIMSVWTPRRQTRWMR